MAERVSIGIINEQVHVPVRADPVEARWLITGNVEILLSIKGDTIRQAGQILDKDFFASRRPVCANRYFADAMRERFDDVEFIPARGECHAVSETHGLGVPEVALPALQIKAPHTRSRLCLVMTVRDIEAIS